LVTAACGAHNKQAKKNHTIEKEMHGASERVRTYLLDNNSDVSGLRREFLQLFVHLRLVRSEDGNLLVQPARPPCYLSGPVASHNVCFRVVLRPNNVNRQWGRHVYSRALGLIGALWLEVADDTIGGRAVHAFVSRHLSAK
jgi:hypothetical protein